MSGYTELANEKRSGTMWNTQHTFNADLGYAMRMVVTGHATPEQAAAACGVSVDDIRAMLAACPQLQLQEVERSR
jgi:hypothetical protein